MINDLFSKNKINQLNIEQDLARNVIFDAHWTDFRGLITTSFSGTGCIRRLELVVLIRLSRLRKKFKSVHADSWKEYKNCSPEKTMKNLERALIRFSIPWLKHWSDRAKSGCGLDLTSQIVDLLPDSVVGLSINSFFALLRILCNQDRLKLPTSRLFLFDFSQKT